MTLGAAVMELLAAWDEFQADNERYDDFAEAVERLREKAAGLIDAHAQPQVICPPSMGTPYPLERLREMQEQYDAQQREAEWQRGA